jgi:hypothetical protein
MSCNNCYNGCTETTSDQCVKYTGIDIPELNIVKGDALNVVLLKITNAIIAEGPILCSIAPEYIGYDLINDLNRNGIFSVDFSFIPSQVLVGVPLVPCTAGTGPSGGGGVSNCPLGIIEYQINNNPKITTTSPLWGNDANLYVLGCEETAVHLNSSISVLAYRGQTITVKYKVTYPTTPPITFNQSITAPIPV